MDVLFDALDRLMPLTVGAKPGGYVYAPLPTATAASQGNFHAPYANGSNNGCYGQGYNGGTTYVHNQGPSAGGTALAAGAGALGGFLLADALF
jgi:hypothetical protein